MHESVKLWTDLSTSDLISSRLLYNNGHHRTSYFFFQQATEKANKAYALFSGLLGEDELIDIGHNQLKIYRKSIAKQEGEIKSLIQILKQFPSVIKHELFEETNFVEYHKSLSNGVNFIDSLKDFDLVNIPKNELDSILEQLTKLQKTKITLPKDYETVFKKQLLGITDWIGQFKTQEAFITKANFEKIINDKNEIKQLYELMTNQLYPMMVDIAFLNMTLFFCAIITIQHSSRTRYPIDIINPDTIYSKQLSIVKKQPEFMDFLEQSINILKNINAA